MIIGSLAINDPKCFEQILNDYSNRITLAIDIKLNEANTPYVTSNAWTRISNISAYELLDRYSNIDQVLCTDIDRDGMLSGSNVDLYEDLSKKYPNIKFIASGGVTSIGELKLLNNRKVAGAIIGRALYEKNLDLSEVINAL